MKYRDDMTPAETAALLGECDALDKAYAEANAIDEANAKAHPGDDEDLDAAWEQDNMDKIAGR